MTKLSWKNAGNYNILGLGTSTLNQLFADTSSPDGQNEVYFDTVTDSNTIAVTTVWEIFSDPPKTRELVEWDQVFNTDYLWSEDAAGSNTEMDYNNISTHELGHAVGLADLYTSDCSQQTMYDYASNGETKKQTLESGDINGISKLYK